MINNHWRDIASLILLAALIFTAQRCNSERSIRLRMQSELSRQETIANIETQRREIAGREKKYPVIDRRLRDIRKAVEKINREVSGEAEKANVNSLAVMFREKGYNCLAIAR